MIAISGVAAAIATAEALKKTNTAGTVVLLGTPAEEVCSIEGGGKPKMLQLGAWKDADASIMCHPAPATVSAFTSTAVASCKVEYFGAPAHAAASPWEGKNTLDALTLAHTAIGLLRQQLLPSDRIHGKVEESGKVANIIPEYSYATYIVRSPHPKRVVELKAKVGKMFQGRCNGHRY